MLKVEKLNISRGNKRLIADLSFSVSSGESLLITGQNGSGKSTLASVIANDYRADSGEVLIEGKLGVLLQNIEIDFPITVSEFLDLADESNRNQELIDRLISPDLLPKKITQLSVGQLQRVEIAQVIKQDPDIYLLDEPFSAQDRENSEILIEILKTLKSKGKSIVLINHIKLDLNELVDQVLDLS